MVKAGRSVFPDFVPGDAEQMGGLTARTEEAFQDLLLQLSSIASRRGADAEALLPFFCRATRAFFHVDGTYFLQVSASDELTAAEGDGWLSDAFRGRRMNLNQNQLLRETLLGRRTIFINRAHLLASAVVAEFHARSIMAAPVIVSNEIMGVVMFLHKTDPDFFNDDLAAKATILAGQVGSLLEAGRLSQVSREEHRRTEILAEVAHVLHAVPDSKAVVEALADRLRILLRSHVVCVFLRDAKGFQLQAVAADSARLSSSIRADDRQKGLHFAKDVAARAVAAGGPITVSIDPANHPWGDLIPAGTLIAAPLRTSKTQGAVLVYPRDEVSFTDEEKSLVSAVAGFGAVAIANAELYDSAKDQAQELHKLLEISAELGSIANLEKFMQHFVVRAADFLGFGRAFIGFLEDGAFQVRWRSDKGRAVASSIVLPGGAVTSALVRKDVFWSNDLGKAHGVDQGLVREFALHDLLAVPLVDTDGEVLGMFGVVDRMGETEISAEDIRRARVLAGQVAIALEVTRNLHLAEQHRKRADSLMQLALELSSLLRVPQFAEEFVARAMDMTSSRGGALLLKQRTDFETLVLVTGNGQEQKNGEFLRGFTSTLAAAIAKRQDAIISTPASDLLGADLASALGWNDLTTVRLQGAKGELVGLLCLAKASQSFGIEDVQLLKAIAGHASVALENARLFTRMEQANQHWMEIFDAMSDFIVVHDISDNVLRVNRSLADFIGLAPKQLIGVKMGAVLAMGKDVTLPSCPFCGNGTGTDDEYVDTALERIYLVSTSRVHAAATGEGMQTIHVLKDITDRREAERRYRELFDNIQEGLFFSTPEGRFVEVNDALVRMLGYSTREDLLQEDLRTHIFESVDHHQELVDLLRQTGVVRNHEQTLRHRDGSTVHVLINAFAVRDRQGNILQFRGVMLDISGLKNFQAELQRERDFSGKILNNTQSLIVVADTAGLISYANRRWSDLGYEQSQLLGQKLIELVAPAKRDVFKAAFDSILAGQQVDNLELLILRGDSRISQFSVNLSPMRDEQGHVASLVVVMTDVTDAAMLQAKLLHAEKMAAVGQLVSGVAHEVNNPLTAILGFTDLLMDDPALPENARRDLRVVLQEAQRTKQIVQNLLSFARQMPPQKKPVHLNSILRRTVQLRAYDLHNHGVEVVEQLDQELPSVIGDSHQLQQVFLNILNNAYDAVRESGRPARIEIMTARLGEFVEVSFRDNGGGIENPDRIFDPFYTTKEVGKGTGLGLSICYGIVHEHGGEILCFNNSGADGATFVVRLPALSEVSALGAIAGVTQR